MRGVNSWSGAFTSKIPALNNRHRLRQLRQFMGVDSLEGVHSLDIGPKNFISEQMKVEHQTRGDVNRGLNSPNFDYETVLCLELLQHTQNHLTVVEGIYERLKVGGKLYLSTPKQGLIAWYAGKGNYVEFKPYNVIKLLEYVGFKILRVQTFKSWPFRFVFMGFLQPIRWWFPGEGETLKHPGSPKAKWYFMGIRPILRYLHNRYILIEAEKVA